MKLALCTSVSSILKKVLIAAEKKLYPFVIGEILCKCLSGPFGTWHIRQPSVSL